MRLLRRPVSLMYALGMLAMGIALGLAFAEDLVEWSGILTWGLMIVGVVFVLTDAMIRQTAAARRQGGARDDR